VQPVFREALDDRLLEAAHDGLALLDGQVAPEEKQGAGDLEMVALNKKIGTSTEIRIAPPNIFASLS
jgi:hypothetical protein